MEEWKDKTDSSTLNTCWVSATIAVNVWGVVTVNGRRTRVENKASRCPNCKDLAPFTIFRNDLFLPDQAHLWSWVPGGNEPPVHKVTKNFPERECAVFQEEAYFPRFHISEIIFQSMVLLAAFSFVLICKITQQLKYDKYYKCAILL